MVNSEKFAKRLLKILEYYDLSAAAFADSIEVGRSSISHILSGRNKPGLDFVMKTVSTYPEVNIYWLLNGKGSFPKEEIPEKESSFLSPILKEETAKTPSSEKEIQKIVFFYADETFEDFNA